MRVGEPSHARMNGNKNGRVTAYGEDTLAMNIVHLARKLSGDRECRVMRVMRPFRVPRVETITITLWSGQCK